MLNENIEKEANNMKEKEKNEQEETKEEEVKSEENNEKETESEEKKEPTLEEKYNALYKEKTDKDREIRHSESYKKYDLSQENINLLKRYLGDKEDIEEEL